MPRCRDPSLGQRSVAFGGRFEWLLHHRDERAEVREEDHVAREVVFELLAEVRVAAPQQPRVLGDKDAFERLQPARVGGGERQGVVFLSALILKR